MLNLSRSVSDRGGFRGGGGVGWGDALFRISTPCRPLCNILRYPFLVTDQKNFLKAPIYTFFGGGDAFFGLFFQKFASSAENLAQTGSFECFGELGKSIWSA